MKKIILTFIAMLLAGVNTALAQNVAKIGTTEYPTLAAAIDAVSDGGTITMIADVDGAPGMKVQSGKNFTVDFNGKTYTLNKPGAGSTSTETNGFQLLTGSTITFKNGTINISEENLTEAVAPAKNIKRIIQNYANLTLENMTIDGTNQFGIKELVVSLNNGTCAITGNTSIIAGTDPVDPIMDVSQWSSYDGPVVTINTTGTIGGNIDINVQAIKSRSLTVQNGNVQGTIVNSTPNFDVPVSVSGGTFEEALPENYLAADFILSKNADGTYGVINEANAVAQIGDYGYETLAEAFAAVQDGGVIELLKNVTLTGNITFELESGKIYFKFNGKTVNKGDGNFHVLLPEGSNPARALAPSENGGAIIYTDKITDIFAAAEGSTILTGPSDDPNYSYFYQAVADDDENAIARNEQTGMLFDDLQTAVDLAQAGQTIKLLPAIEGVTIENTVVINKNITIDGQGDEGDNLQVTSDAKVAFEVTGPGSVTFNKVDINAQYYEATGAENGQKSGSRAIKVDKQFSDSLVINYSTIKSTGRGIDVYDVNGGFVLDVKHSNIEAILQDGDEKEAGYINSFDYDPDGRGRGISFGHKAASIVANIQFSKIQGYAYPVHVSDNSGKVELNMTDCSTWGRNIINNWGDNSTFNLKNVTSHSYNNEDSDDNEAFAAILDYMTADKNFYNIEDLKVVAVVKAADIDPTSATQNFIDLRGTNATVKITGNSGYVTSDTDTNLSKEIRDRVGFVNKLIIADDVEVGESDAYKRMIDKTVNNRIYFDDESKSYFNFWFEIMEPFEYDYDNDTEDELIRIAIDDKVDYTNLFPVVPLEVKVRMTIMSEDSGEPVVLYYGNLEDAFNSELFGSAAEIQLLSDVELDEDITVKLERGEDFTLTLINDGGDVCAVNVSNDASIKLPPLVYAYCNEDQGEELFTSADETLEVIKGANDGVSGLIKYYVPANVYYADTKEKAVGNPDDDEYEPNIDGGLLWIFKDLLSTDADAMLQITPDCYVRLEADVTLEDTYTLPIGGDVDNEEVFYLDLNGNTIEGEYKSLVMRLGTAIYTTGTIDIFSSIDPEYTVVYDVLDTPIETTYTDFEGNSKTVSFTHKYYLVKDGLAVIVDPSTYCGDRLTPNFIVKKKVVDAVTGEESWVVLEDETDYTWSLVPPATDDADDKTYIDAKTYVQAIVIEGITFQGTRKADFTILPRDIKDVTASGNEQPWTDDGYAPMSDEEEGIVGIEDLIQLQYFCKNHGDAANPILKKYVEEIDEITGELLKSGDYIISVENGPETDPAGYYKEIDTYSKVITITAVEGGNYTGTLKLDFTILPEGLIDITKAVVTSNAVYTSLALYPTKERLKVVVKANGIVRLLKPEDYKLQVHGMLGKYIDAKTYSNAITITGVPERGYYGSFDADYVISPRDLGDDVLEDDNAMVIIESYGNEFENNDPNFDLAEVKPLLWKDSNNDGKGDVLVPMINSYNVAGVTTETDNNINLVLKVNGTTTPGYKWVLLPQEDKTATTDKDESAINDFSYTIEPAPMVDPGIYKVIFTGRGNFTGMREVNVMVLKDINELADNIKMPYQIIPDNLALTPSQMKGIEVKDGNKVLVENEEYTLVIKGGKPGEIFDEENPIYVKGKYYACFYGKEPYYTGQYVDDFRAFFEYIGWDTNPVAGTGTNIYNNPTSIAKKPDTNGNIIASSGLEYDETNKTPVSVRITDVSDSLNLKAEITYIDNINEGTVTACDPTKEIVKVKPTFQIAAGLDNGAARYFTFNIVGVQDNAFKDLPRIHCLDLTQIEGYTPDNLTRSEDGPFNYYPVQSLVYFDGTQGGDVTGTNYIYKKGENDFRCEELKIYDDIKGDQQGFETDADYIGGGHGWEFRNIYQFVADKVTNTRVFLAGQHYTTCLPYKLQMNSALKAYTLDAASDNIFGFKQYTAKELDQFTPYVLIPSKGGNLLNNDESTVCYVTPTSNRGFLPLDERGNRRYDFATPTGHIMYGSNIYMGSSSTYPTVEGLYIMQSKNQWKRIPAGKTYNNACVLPMRGYIMLPNHPQISGSNPSRESSDGPEYISAKYMDVDGVAEISIDVNDDWTNAEVYDLQGRKVDTTARLPKGVYIVNGQKRIRK